jgi:hypothetical protein
MFGPRHYVPILRWKQAERYALRYLHEEDRKRITPLIELTPTIFKSRRKDGQERKRLDPAQILEREAKKLLEAWVNCPFFLDLCYVAIEVPRTRGNIHALEYLAEIGRNYKLALVPVTGLSRTEDYQSSVGRVLKEDGRGICLRITPSEVLQNGFANTIRAFLKSFGLDVKSVHLLLDYETTDPAGPDPQSLLAEIPDLNKWQTLSLARGAFPPDLQGLQPGNSRIPREDWLAWKRTVTHHGKNRQRKPAFSDYTIQYGLYKEPVEGCNPSASIRYTLEDEWLIMRGEALRGRPTSNRAERRPGPEQWNAHAQLLCDDEKLFYGESFSWGDAFIRERSINTENHGSPEIWLRAGINHHMTVVSRQIANLHVA